MTADQIRAGILLILSSLPRLIKKIYVSQYLTFCNLYTIPILSQIPATSVYTSPRKNYSEGNEDKVFVRANTQNLTCT